MVLTRFPPSRTRARTSMYSSSHGRQGGVCVSIISVERDCSALGGGSPPKGKVGGLRVRLPASWRRLPPIQAPRGHLSLDQNRALAGEEACRSTRIASSLGKEPCARPESPARWGRRDRQLATTVFAEIRGLLGREKGADSDQERLSGRARGPISVRDRLCDHTQGGSGEHAYQGVQRIGEC